MKITVWPGVRLTVWERQNPDAVKVVLPFTKHRDPVRRVLSARGWMVLLVRYDWRHRHSAVREPGNEGLVRMLVQEMHRSTTHLETVRHGGSSDDATLAYARGMSDGVTTSLGVALGGHLNDGSAKRLATRRYTEWQENSPTGLVRCTCDVCEQPARSLRSGSAVRPGANSEESQAWHAVWLEGDWDSLTRKMSATQREVAADHVAAYSSYLRGQAEEPEGLRWWRS